MKVSIIIPTRRNDLALSQCIDSIKQYTVDYQLVLIKGEASFTCKINSGIKQAQGDYVIFLHDDCEVTENWTQTLPTDGVGTFCLGENNDSLDIWGGFVNPPRYCTDPTENPDYAYWLCIHKDAMKKIGPFDERFKNPMYQDVDMGLQVKKAGYKIECLSGKIIHRNGEGSGTPDEQQRGYVNRKWNISL
jgi:GT2 family glycosyltransferase